MNLHTHLFAAQRSADSDFQRAAQLHCVNKRPPMHWAKWLSERSIKLLPHLTLRVSTVQCPPCRPWDQRSGLFKGATGKSGQISADKQSCPNKYREPVMDNEILFIPAHFLFLFHWFHLPHFSSELELFYFPLKNFWLKTHLTLFSRLKIQSNKSLYLEF